MPVGINVSAPGQDSEELAIALIAALRFHDYAPEADTLARVLGLNDDGDPAQTTGETYTTQAIDDIATGLGIILQLSSETVSLADSTFPLSEAIDPDVKVTRGSFFNDRVKPFLGRNRRTLLAGAVKTDFFNNGAAGFSKLADAETTDPLIGKTAVRLSIGPTAGSAALMPAALYSTPIDMSAGGQIRIWFRPVSNFDGLASFDLRLYSAGSHSAKPGAYHRISEGADTDANIWINHATSVNGVGRWQSLGIPVTLMQREAAGADLQAVTFIELVISNADGQTVQLDLFRIEYVPPALTKAKVCFTFDDGYELPQTMALLNKYGFPATFMPGAAATIRDENDDENMRPKQLQNRHDFGDQVASQTWTVTDAEAMAAMSDAQRTAFFAKIFAWQAALGLSGAQDGSYFESVGPTTLAAYPAIRQHFRSMRRVDTGRASGFPLALGEMFPFSDPMNYRALSIASYTGEDAGERYISHVEQAIINGGVAVFADSKSAETDAGPNYANIRAGYEELLEFLDANRIYVDVCTIDDLHRQGEFTTTSLGAGIPGLIFIENQPLTISTDGVDELLQVL